MFKLDKFWFTIFCVCPQKIATDCGLWKTGHACKGRSMDDSMKQLQEKLIEVEIEAEKLLLARQQLIENDRVRNGNREALTALRRRAKTTKTSVPTPFESLMRDVESRPLVKEVCPTCGNHDSKEKTWVMFPGADVFANIPFHAAHTILEKGFFLTTFML
nr:uncharacterized protein LOC104097609 isoform X1 [Nicotiana tomentosiformis]